jgi:hypothetical protein
MMLVEAAEDLEASTNVVVFEFEVGSAASFDDSLEGGSFECGDDNSLEVWFGVTTDSAGDVEFLISADDLLLFGDEDDGGLLVSDDDDSLEFLANGVLTTASPSDGRNGESAGGAGVTTTVPRGLFKLFMLELNESTSSSSLIIFLLFKGCFWGGGDRVVTGVVTGTLFFSSSKIRFLLLFSRGTFFMKEGL